MLVYGHQGSGKTTFFGSSGHALVLAFEPGAQFQSGAMRRVERWAPDPKGLDKRMDFLTMVNAITESARTGKLRERGIKIVVGDTIDRLHQICTTAVCEANDVVSIGDIPFGKGYAMVTNLLQGEIRKLAAFVPVAFTSHCITVTEELENRSGVKKEVERLKPSVDRRIGEWLAGEQNLVGYAYKSAEGEFLLKFHSDPRLESKDRTGLFEKGRKPIKTSWTAVVDAYNDAAKAAGVTLRSRWG